MEPSRNLVLFGTDEHVAEPLELRAGPLEMTLRHGKLWRVRLDDDEVWHGVAFLYRDPDWGTPELVIEHFDCTASGAAFQLAYAGHFPTSPPIAVRVEIEGTSDGHISLRGEAVPDGDIQANRLGICVMHPLSAVGARIEIEHIDGRTSRSTFPTLIPPWPPFTLIRAIRHEYAANRWARCELSGDFFEFEDQRNNADASFKTYSRSNLMPRPYWLRAGVPIRQSVDLRLEPPWSRSPSRRSLSVAVTVGKEARDLPKIGIEISARDVGADDATRVALRAMRPTLLHLPLGDEEEVASMHWKGVGELLALAGARLRLDVRVPAIRRSRAMLEALSAMLGEAGIVPESIALFPAEQPCIDAARDAFPATLVGAGTPHFFAQINRVERLGDADFLTFTTSAVVHGADDNEVMLGLQSLPSMIDTLRARYPGVPIRIGPSGIAARSSPLGSQPATDGMRRIALARCDPRCRGLFGAAWLLGYVAQCALAGADAVSVLSLTGDSGVVARAGERVLTGYPAYFVLARLHAPARVCSVSISDPSRIAALALSRDDKRELLLANLTGDALDVKLDGWAASFPASIMDARSWSAISWLSHGWNASRRTPPSSHLRLEPYAVASLERRS